MRYELIIIIIVVSRSILPPMCSRTDASTMMVPTAFSQKLCAVEHIKYAAAHAIPAFSKCFFIRALPRSPPITPHTNAAMNVTGHIHIGISFVTESM